MREEILKILRPDGPGVHLETILNMADRKKDRLNVSVVLSDLSRSGQVLKVGSYYWRAK